MKYFAGYIIFAVFFAAVPSRADYSYSTQSQWPGVCTTGVKQSPINIQTRSVLCNADLKPLLLSHKYYTKMSGTWANKGHTVQFTPRSGTRAYMLTPIGTYKLRQVHMHWGRGNQRGSEHLVNNGAADGEVHFVHQKVGAVDETDCDYYAVLGVRVDSSPSVPLDGIFNALDPAVLETYPSLTLMTDINLSSLLPDSLDYYHYQGSLTTPNCDERVQWFVLKNSIDAPQAYLEKLRRIKDKNSAAVTWNYRYPQELNGRRVSEVGVPTYMY